MTRPKVDPDKRQRTANACDACKRRKQKCDGQQPCATCHKKQFTCTYNSPDYRANTQSSPDPAVRKRIRADGGSTDQASPSMGSDISGRAPGLTFWQPGGDTPSSSSAARIMNPLLPNYDIKSDAKVPLEKASSSGGEEEAENHTMTRMVEDGMGRLVYIGDSATLSFLQLLRMIIESVAGPTPFSLDPGRHRITEIQFSLPPNAQLTHQLPPKETTLILVDAFFVNTHGLLQVFDEKTFLNTVGKVYLDPLTVDHVFLCHLNLVLAIGLCLATPEIGSPEAAVVDAVRSKHPNQSEVFYLVAKDLNDPTTNLEDGETWTIQTLLLMATYMLYRSKRNPSYLYIGMAVRIAYALGMHREETLVIFPAEEQEKRKFLWRSLFVLDRFLAVYLGRPVAIVEEECTGEILHPRSDAFADSTHLGSGHLCSAGLEASVRSCHVIGIILRRVYLQRRISTKLAQEIADECKHWPEKLSPALHWRRSTSSNRRQAMAILHCNLAYCHSIILLSRPFFLYLLSSEIQKTYLRSDPGARRSRGKMEKFSDACIIASVHVVALVQNAYEGRYLPQMDSIAIYSLFGAALNIFANEFVRPSSNALSSQCMANAISILSFCGQMNFQAKRAAHVLEEFRDVIQRQAAQPALQLQVPRAFQASLPAFRPSTNNQEASMPSLERGFTPIPALPGANTSSSLGPMTARTSAFDGTASAPLSLPHEDSFSGFLDLNNTVLPTLSDPESSGADEAIEFDAWWGGWPSDTQTPNFETRGGRSTTGGTAVFNQA